MTDTVQNDQRMHDALRRFQSHVGKASQQNARRIEEGELEDDNYEMKDANTGHKKRKHADEIGLMI